MRKIITKTLILPILVFTLAFCAFVLPSSFAEAHATGEVQKTLYYFSDDSHCINYKTQLVNFNIVDVCVLYNWSDESRYRFFEDAYFENYDYIDWNNMQNAYIIFEMNTGFRENQDLQAGDTVFPLVLEDLFSYLKSQGCHIMFICGTDESLFENYNHFLTYVDIHINTDIFSSFMIQIFESIIDNGSERFGNVTFILDESFGGLSGISENAFFINWIKRYIEFNNPEYLYILDSNWQWICEDLGIKIFIYSNGSYRDAFYPQVVLPDPDTNYEYFMQYIINPYICAIGTSWRGSQALSEFVEAIDDLGESMQCDDLMLYVYNQSSFPLPDLSNCTLHKAGAYADYYDIIVDFLNDENLSDYDNWDGKCDITHKAMLFGEDGWITCPSRTYSCWYVYAERLELPEVPYIA